jgi:hypothetical protein
VSKPRKGRSKNDSVEPTEAQRHEGIHYMLFGKDMTSQQIADAIEAEARRQGLRK